MAEPGSAVLERPPVVPATPEAPRVPEREYTNAEAIAALNFGRNLLNQEIDSVQNNGGDSKDLQWVRQSIDGTMQPHDGDPNNRIDLDNGVFQFTNRFENHHTGIHYEQQEGVPVDELIAFLQQKASTYPQNSQERRHLEEQAHILYKKSKFYHEFDDRQAIPQIIDRVEQENSKLSGRIHHEAYFISKDQRGENFPGDMDKHWFDAKRALTRRRELFLTPEETPTPTPIPVTTDEPEETEHDDHDDQNDDNHDDENHDNDHDDDDNNHDEEEQDDDQQPTRSDFYDVMIGSQNEDIRKLVARSAELQLEQRLTENFPVNLPQNRALRIGRLVAHSINPANWRRMMFNNTKEYWRQVWIGENYQNLRQANFGATTTLAADAAARVNEQLSQLRAEGKQTVARMHLGTEAVRLKETAPTEAQGALRSFILNDILKPTTAQLRPLTQPDGTVDENQINDIENRIQEQISNYVRTNQNTTDPALRQQIRDFFGEKSDRYGQMSEFYASDIVETARRIIADQRADEFARNEIDEIIKIKLFNARWAEQTEGSFNWVDRRVADAERYRLTGTLINSATIGLAADIGAFLGLRAMNAGVNWVTFGVPLAGALAGGTNAFIRRNSDLKRFHQEAARQIEAGETSDDHDVTPQRKELERFILPLMATQDQLINGGGNDIFGTPTERASVDQLLLNHDWNGLARRYAEIKARLDFPVHSTRVNRFILFGARDVPQDIGVISYQGRDQMSKGQTELARQLINIRQALVDPARGGLTDQQFTDLMNTVEEGNENSGLVVRATNRLVNNKQAQERAFNAYRLRQALDSAGAAAVTGGVIGLVAQEALAVIGRLSPEAATLPFVGGAFRQGTTVLEQPFQAVRNLVDQTTTPTPSVPGVSTETFKQLYSSSGSVDIPGNLKIDIQPDHSLTILDETTNQGIPNLPKMMLQPDGHIQATGTIQPQLMEQLRSEGFTITQNPDIVTPGETTIQQKPTLGPDGEWTKHTTNVDHREAYSYDQPGSQANELRMHTIKQGSTVTLDMSTMGTGFQKGLNPNQINVADVIRDKQAGWYFSLPNSPQDGIWVSDGVDGVWDGKLTLNPNDTNPAHVINTSRGPLQLGEFSKMVLNQNALAGLPDGDIATEARGRLNVFNLGENGKNGFIEAGRLVEGKSGGVLQNFATIRGEGNLPQSVGVPVETPSQRLASYDITPPNATNTVVPPATESAPLPFVETPMVARRPLEPLTAREIPQRQPQDTPADQAEPTTTEPNDPNQPTPPVAPAPAPQPNPTPDQPPATATAPEPISPVPPIVPPAAPEAVPQPTRRGPRPGQPPAAAAVPITPENTNTADQINNIPYERLASQMPIDEQHPAQPENFLPPMGGNMFASTDNPTLAGRAILRVYNNLIQREIQEPASRERSVRLAQASRTAPQEFTQSVQRLNQQRQQTGLSPVSFAQTHTAGQDEFHLDGGNHLEHQFYFSKSHTNWRQPNAPEVRAYITLPPSETNNVAQYFTDLATELYDAGIDFSAKAAGPIGMADRTDNIVFYISQPDQQRAADIIRNFLTTHNIGEGHVNAAQPDTVDGLSWAPEPNETQNRIWREVSGSSENASFNSYIAAMVVPDYLERLAQVNERAGNIAAATQFRQEAQRARTVIARNQRPNQPAQSPDNTSQQFENALNGLAGGITESMKARIQELVNQAISRADSGNRIDDILADAPSESARAIIKMNVIDHFLKEANDRREAEVVEGSIGDRYWQQPTFGPPLQRRSGNLFRGYLMVEPQDIPNAVRLLIEVARQRQTQGRSTMFKWLKQTITPDNPVAPENLGFYPNLQPTDPRIALYGDNPQDIQEILQALADNPTWQQIEQNRINAYGGQRRNAPRRPGTNTFIDQSGRQWRSLNFNNASGYSEDEAADPNWRDIKLGDRTVLRT